MKNNPIPKPSARINEIPLMNVNSSKWIIKIFLLLTPLDFKMP